MTVLYRRAGVARTYNTQSSGGRRGRAVPQVHGSSRRRRPAKYRRENRRTRAGIGTRCGQVSARFPVCQTLGFRFFFARLDGTRPTADLRRPLPLNGPTNCNPSRRNGTVQATPAETPSRQDGKDGQESPRTAALPLCPTPRDPQKEARAPLSHSTAISNTPPELPLPVERGGQSEPRHRRGAERPFRGCVWRVAALHVWQPSGRPAYFRVRSALLSSAIPTPATTRTAVLSPGMARPLPRTNARLWHAAPPPPVLSLREKQQGALLHAAARPTSRRKLSGPKPFIYPTPWRQVTRRLRPYHPRRAHTPRGRRFSPFDTPFRAAVAK